MRISFLLIVVLLVAGFGMPAFAQNQYFRNFDDTMKKYYDIHEKRIEYLGTYVENRRVLDTRRKDFEGQRQKAVKAYNLQRESDTTRIDYDLGISDF